MSSSSKSRSGASPHEEVADKLTVVKREVTSAISNSHGLSIADLVLVPPGSIPITTSGKVRRAACVEQYRHGQFARLDYPVRLSRHVAVRRLPRVPAFRTAVPPNREWLSSCRWD